MSALGDPLVTFDHGEVGTNLAVVDVTRADQPLVSFDASPQVTLPCGASRLRYWSPRAARTFSKIAVARACIESASSMRCMARSVCAISRQSHATSS